MVEFRLDDHKDKISEIFHEFSVQRKSTSEADFKKTEAAIRRLYLLNNYRPPGKFFHVKSPVEAEIIKKIFCTSEEGDLWNPFWNSICIKLPYIESPDFPFLDFWDFLNDIDNPLFTIYEPQMHNDEVVFNNIWDKTFNKYWEKGIDTNWNSQRQCFLKQTITFLPRIKGFTGFWLYYQWAQAEILRRIGFLFDKTAILKLKCINEIVYSCGFTYLYRDFAIICDRPSEMHHDTIGRIHNEKGMAMTFSDGCGIYAINGINVPECVVMRPHEITKKDIYKEKNTELRRIMIERLGAEKFVSIYNAKVVHEDADQLGNCRRLLKVEMMEGDWFAIEVTDSSKTQDEKGNWRNKKYYLSINPKHYNGRAGRECQAAIASTWRHGYDKTKLFFNKPEDYVPIVET